MIDWLRLIGSLSLAGSILALAMLLIRPVARHFLSKRLLYLLWLLVIFQLLIPIPAGQIAFGKLMLQPMQTIKVSQAAAPGSADAAANEDSASIHRSAGGTVDASAVLESSSGSTEQKPSNGQSAGTTANDPVIRMSQVLQQTWADLTSIVRPLALLLFLVWLFGALFLLGLAFHRYHRLMRLIHANASCASESEQQVLVNCCRTLGISRYVKLMRNASAPSPILTGIFHPTIYLPEKDLPSTDLRLILDHELTHLKSGDLIIKLLMQVTCAIHWFNPLLKVIQRQFLLDCELACDESVARRLTQPDRRQYGELLLQQAEMSTYRHLAGAEALSVNGRQLRQRLQAVLHVSQSSLRNRIISAVIVVMLVVAAFGIGAVAWPNRSTTQRYTVDQFNVYQTDWQKLFDQFGMSTQARVDRLRIEFSIDGKISKFALDAIDQASADDRDLMKRVEVDYDPQNRQLKIESNASAPFLKPGNATDLRLIDKSTLSRVVMMLDRPDWAAQTKAADFPYWGMAFEGDASLGTPIDHTFLIRADGSLANPKQPDMPLPYGTTLNLFGMANSNGPSEKVYYYLLSDKPVTSGSANGSTANSSASTAETIKNTVAHEFTEVYAEPDRKAADIAGANFYNRKTMAFDGSRLYWIMPDYGNTIVASNMSGQDRVVLYPASKNDGFTVIGGFKLLTVNGRSLLFVSEGVGLFKIPVDGGTAKKLIEGNIQDYIIKDNMIYYSDFKSDLTADDGFYALKSYNTDTQKITVIDQLSIGKELLKIGGYIVGFQNGELIYTRRDDKNRRGYFSYAPDGTIKSIPYEKGQQIETEMAKKGLRPLDQESSEVSHVEGKSLVIEYHNPDPNILHMSENNNRRKIAEVKGNYVYLFNGQIFVLDRESNVEHIILKN